MVSKLFRALGYTGGISAVASLITYYSWNKSLNIDEMHTWHHLMYHEPRPKFLGVFRLPVVRGNTGFRDAWAVHSNETGKTYYASGYACSTCGFVSELSSGISSTNKSLSYESKFATRDGIPVWTDSDIINDALTRNRGN